MRYVSVSESGWNDSLRKMYGTVKKMQRNGASVGYETNGKVPRVAENLNADLWIMSRERIPCMRFTDL